MARAQGWPYQASKELLRRIASHNSKLGFKWDGNTKKYINKKDSYHYEGSYYKDFTSRVKTEGYTKPAFNKTISEIPAKYKEVTFKTDTIGDDT